MRVMVIVRASKDSEAGVMPDTDLLVAMGKFNEELVKAGVMLSGEGLHPSRRGVRVRYAGASRTVVDGPFAETKELIAGFWVWQVRSMEEANGRGGARTRTRATARSRSARSSKPRISAKPSRPSCASRKTACARSRRSASSAGGEATRSCNRRMARDLHLRMAAVWRIEAAKVIGAVARMVRDVGLAGELAQNALVSALDHWPKDGIPDNPAAWLTATAKNRALDRLRQAALHARKHQELGADADARGDHVVPDFSDALDGRDTFGDDLLRLVFAVCHPVLSKEAQVALTLRLLGGLTTEEIARAHLVPEATIAQRIVRAKRTLTAAPVPFEVPQATRCTRGSRRCSR